MTDTKHICFKLQEAKEIVAGKKLNQSGRNTFSNYSYFELADIMPAILEACKQVGIATYVTFTDEFAVLKITDGKDDIDVCSPMSTADLKGCHDVQNLGAVQSYLRRYLYMAAFDIVEGDTLDRGQAQKADTRQTKAPPAQQNKPPANKPAAQQKPSDLCPACSGPISTAEIEWSVKKFGQAMCRSCQKMAAGQQ